MKIGARIRELRTSRGLTLSQLARLSGVAREHVWAVEQAKYAPSLGTIEKLAKGFATSPARLLSPPQGDELFDSQFVRQVYSLLKRGSQIDRTHILRVLQSAPSFRVNQ